MTEPDIVEDIWNRCFDPGCAYDTAEQRAALDKRLRAEIDGVADPALKPHVREMIRAHRAAVFRPDHGWKASIERRLAALERGRR